MNGETRDDEPDHEQRIERVLARARSETGARDLLTFSVASVWAVVLALGAAVFALVHRPSTKPPNDAPKGETEESS